MTATEGTEEPLSIQQRLYPQTACFGCGPINAKGLHLRSYAKDGVIVATFEPSPEHDNGLGYLNGGIISTLLDCHSAAAVLREAEEHGWRAMTGTVMPFVTAGLNVRFLRPAPLYEAVDLRAAVLRASEEEITAEVQLVADGKTRASALALWRRWRPRQ